MDKTVQMFIVAGLLQFTAAVTTVYQSRNEIGIGPWLVLIAIMLVPMACGVCFFSMAWGEFSRNREITRKIKAGSKQSCRPTGSALRDPFNGHEIPRQWSAVIRARAWTCAETVARHDVLFYG